MKRNKRALITGITGQDGSYLAPFLLKKGYDVYGLVRRSSSDPFYRIEQLRLPKKIKILYGDLRDTASIDRAIAESQPDEIYNLAALADVGISFLVPEETIEINYYGVGRLTNRAMTANPKVRIYQASTSDMFGNAKPPYNEKTRYNTTSPYGESKLKAHQDFVEEYRRRYNLFICSGIMFNHESPVRHKNCVTRKITHSLAKIKLGKQEYFELGNIDTKRDWGYAGDYVEAMWKMLQQKKPDDYVIATGKSHSVRDFLNAAAKAIDIDIIWSGKGLKEIGKNKKTGKTIVKINKKFFRPTEINHSRGDGSKARRKLGWEPKTSFNELAEMMAKSDLKLVRRETS